MHRSLGRRRFCVLAATGFAMAAVAAGGAGPAAAHKPSHRTATASGLADLAAVEPVMACDDVTSLDLSSAADAPVTITSATLVTSGAAPYCEVRGTIAPNDTIVVRLPTQGWTQRYVQTGCGGLCGSANINYGQAANCPPVTEGTVASATTDMGHQGQNDGSWAANNPQAQIDFAYRGVHVTAQVAKALITKFYGRAPAYSYFTGCSDGGREGLMEAQRYPGDFDGIAAGAPANNMAVQNTYHHAWNVLANLDANGQFILLADKLPLIHQAVLDACDGIDGVNDGLIDDPRLCHFDPATLVCADGQDPSTCLSPAEAEVVRKLHDGAVTADGQRLEPYIAHEWGSELDWTLFIPSAQGQTPMSENFALSYLRYLADPNTPHPDYQLTDLPLTEQGFWDTVLPSSTYMSALDPDLRAFQRGGGKLLLWHGWNDQHISPQNTLAYWDAMNHTMGRGNVDSFARLFLFPGVAHCRGGEGPDTFDVLTPVMAWVETGTAPSEIVATKVTDGTVTQTRVVHAYPKHPAVRNDDEWLGERLFSHGYQTTASVVDGQLVTAPLYRRNGHGHRRP